MVLKRPYLFGVDITLEKSDNYSNFINFITSHILPRLSNIEECDYLLCILDDNFFVYSSLPIQLIDVLIVLSIKFERLCSLDINRRRKLIDLLLLSEKIDPYRCSPDQLIRLCDLMISLDPSFAGEYTMKQDNWVLVKSEGEYRQILYDYYLKKEYEIILDEYLSVFKRHFVELHLENIPLEKVSALYDRKKYKNCIKLIIRWKKEAPPKEPITFIPPDNNSAVYRISMDTLNMYKFLIKCYSHLGQTEEAAIVKKELDETCKPTIIKFLNAMLKSKQVASESIIKAARNFKRFHLDYIEN